MFKIRHIGMLAVIFAVTSCAPVTIPNAYNFRIKDLQTNPYGCWMEIVSDTTENQNFNMSGELLNLAADSTYLLVADGNVCSIKNTSILSARLFTHKNQSGTYFTLGAIFASPALIGALGTEYGGGFLLIGAPVMLVGIVQSIIESDKKRNILVYPQKNNLKDLSLFARFPAGMPENVNYGMLTLKKEGDIGN